MNHSHWTPNSFPNSSQPRQSSLTGLPWTSRLCLDRSTKTSTASSFTYPTSTVSYSSNTLAPRLRNTHRLCQSWLEAHPQPRSTLLEPCWLPTLPIHPTHSSSVPISATGVFASTTPTMCRRLPNRGPNCHYPVRPSRNLVMTSTM